MIIGIEDLKVNCLIGILEKEKEVPQNIYVTIECEVGDSFVDYVQIKELIHTIAHSSHHGLIEELIKAIVEGLKKFPIKSGFIVIKKPDALELAKSAYAKLYF